MRLSTTGTGEPYLAGFAKVDEVLEHLRGHL
jgi:hypothetical protein